MGTEKIPFSNLKDIYTHCFDGSESRKGLNGHIGFWFIMIILVSILNFFYLFFPFFSNFLLNCFVVVAVAIFPIL